MSSDVARHVAGQEGGHIGDVVDCAATAQWDFLHPLGTHLVGQSLGHVGVDEARGDGVGADAAAAHFLSHALGQGDESGLRGGVVGLSGIAVHAHHTGHIDD